MESRDPAVLIGPTKRILLKKTKDQNGLYAPRAPDVAGLAKGKARKPHEFRVLC